MDVRHFIRVYNAFTPDQCNTILKNNIASQWTRHSWYGGTSDKPSATDTLEDDPDINYFDPWFSRELQSKVMDLTFEYFKTISLNGMNCVLNLSLPRVNRYSVGQRMDTHVDHIHSLFDGGNKGIPILSYILLLNDNYEGGDLKFTFIDGSSYIPKLSTGDVVMWPSAFLYNHEVTPVTKGERYSSVIWGW